MKPLMVVLSYFFVTYVRTNASNYVQFLCLVARGSSQSSLTLTLWHSANQGPDLQRILSRQFFMKIFIHQDW